MNDEVFELNQSQLESAVAALRDLAAEPKGTKLTPTKSLFEDEDQLVHMTVVMKKVASHNGKMSSVRCRLPHPYRQALTTAVCLFVKDLSKDKWSPEIDKDAKIFKEELIIDRGVTNITEIISLRQLKREFKTHEAKRKLSSAFDVFAADDRILPMVIRNLGKSFWARKKLPLPVRITEGCDVQQQIEDVLATATFLVKPTGARISAVVGSLSQANGHLLDNILGVFEALRKSLPGGVINIRSVYMSCGKSPVQLPVYASLLSANFVTLPPSSAVPEKTEVTDELTTLDADIFGDDITQVRVRRDGRVILVTRDGVDVVKDKKKKPKKRLGRKRGGKAKKPIKVETSTKVEV